ncbi:hypothetical protein N7474_011074 [Penicillium riverlandense]|uniref:uncharacterized protein n=1 Tax=Penicillium riverlandense TaxID=1903569 RepID=UPI002548214D|nr:uncharacterized protein N7474_011074 [Penicillium riverlandense]KAJ5805187.1 hypothetical protein N7474_011074 [Penicillium riverlandense]
MSEEISVARPDDTDQVLLLVNCRSRSPEPASSLQLSRSKKQGPVIVASSSLSSSDLESPSLADKSDSIRILENRAMGEEPAPAGADRSCALSSSSSSSSWSTAALSSSSRAPSFSTSPRRSPGLYGCLFHMLDCHESFDEIAEWRAHVLSHFHAHPPPPTARCPLCPNVKFTSTGAVTSPGASPILENPTSHESIPDPSPLPTPTSILASEHEQEQHPTAWSHLLTHVATAHYQHGHTLAGSRPDFELMGYLYRLRLISDAQFKAMQLPPAPSSPAYHRSLDGVRRSIGSADEPYCAPYSRRREERLRGQSPNNGLGVV